MNTEKMNEFEQLKQKIVAKEISVSILEAREYKKPMGRGVRVKRQKSYR